MAEELGEIKIIELFRKHLETKPHIFMGLANSTGIHEDAGAIRLENGKLLVVTTDLIGKKTHIPPRMTHFQMGRKAVIVNVSDLAAMGATPLGLVFSTGLPKDIKTEEIVSIAKGMNSASMEYNTCVFGGDTNQTDDIILAGTAIGLTSEEEILLRNGANENDIVAVTDWIGGAALGLYLLKNQFPVKDDILERVLEPKARLSEALKLNKLNAITAAGDITDGLALELHKVCEASTVGVLIEQDKLPIRNNVKEIANSHEIDPVELALYIGEDFELLLTVKSDKWEIVKEQCDKIKLKLTQIGKVTGNQMVLMKSSDGNLKPLKRKGYDQFKKSL